jgi:hypothetical protein
MKNSGPLVVKGIFRTLQSLQQTCLTTPTAVSPASGQPFTANTTAHNDTWTVTRYTITCHMPNNLFCTACSAIFSAMPDHVPQRYSVVLLKTHQSGLQPQGYGLLL